jgi:hypothetical protein
MQSFWLFVLYTEPIAAHLITTPAQLPKVRPTAYPGVALGHDELFGRLPGHQLFKRDVEYCDQHGNMACPVGTCFVDLTGLVGCCTTDYCVARTTCTDYTSGISMPCDVNTGGCFYCSASAAPSCAQYWNTLLDMWAWFCTDSSTMVYTSYSDMYTMSTYDMLSTSTTDSASPGSGLTITTEPTALPPNYGEPVITAFLTTGSTSTGAETYPPFFTPTNSSTSPISNATAITPQTNDNQSGLSNGDVAGIICGSLIAGAILVTALWIGLRRFMLAADNSRKEHRTTLESHALRKAESQNNMATDVRGGGSQINVAEVEGSLPAQGSGALGRHIAAPPYPHSPQHFAGCQPMSEVTEPRISSLDLPPPQQQLQQYRLTNPDPLSPASQAKPRIAVPVPSFPHQVQIPIPPASPPVSSLAAPAGHSRDSSATASPVSPPTPTASAKQLPYPLSNYAEGDNDGRQSSTTKATNEAQGPASIYRGLSRNSGDVPWNYMDPGDAFNGGWTNEE